ncbi:universal stress protein [Thioclava sp.]|uniref:universal stress protein n=1 Tax=Thioclava sp. TaxID=1933450 RepID=UPI003AA7CB65
MFNEIMVPVDLRHVAKLTKALTIAADIARKYGAQITYVGVTGNEPSAVAHTPEEYSEKLAQFAASEAAMHGLTARGHTIVAHDPAVDLNHKLADAVQELHADLVIMATHLPNVADYVWASHGGHLATHSKASVFLVRA